MKKLLLIVTVFCVWTSAQAQQFSFQMNFVDVAGNTDSIIVGYDINGTDTIDALFGETNIIGVSPNNTLDVRVSNEWYNRTYLAASGSYQTKKQIVSYNCDGFWSPIQTIDIRTQHWPVTMTWNNSLFMDSCRNGSVFTSIKPGGWFDTSSPSDLFKQDLVSNNSVTFTSNFAGSYNENFAYVNNNGDTIPVFWQSFADSARLYISIKEISNLKPQLRVYPNPATEKISIQIPLQFGKGNSIEIFSWLGQRVIKTKMTNDINLSFLASGLYLITVTNENGGKLSTRILKE
ncbi:MAG: T9SS type A sorting domain-containing protein [Bacteroidota bacterium]